MLIVGVGLGKLVAYQAWSEMGQRGNTIDILGLNIGAVNGSAFNAANLLFVRRRNSSLSIFVLAHVAIITAVSLVIGKSITSDRLGERGVTLRLSDEHKHPKCGISRWESWLGLFQVRSDLGLVNQQRHEFDLSI